MRRILLALAALFSAGCAPSNADPIALFGGARYDWRQGSHPIGLLAAGTASPTPEGDVLAQLGLDGDGADDQGDLPGWELSWMEIDSDRVAVLDGEVALRIDGSGRASAQVQVDLAAPGFQDWPEVAVALRGFEFDTDEPLADGAPGGYDPAGGWAIQGLGAGVSAPSRGARGIFFEVWMRYEAGAEDVSPRSDNAGFASIDGIVRYSVVASRASRRTAGTLTASSRIQSDGSFAVAAPLPLEERTLVLSGRPRYPMGIPLLRSWELSLNAGQALPGRSLRGFGVRIVDQDYSWMRGSSRVAFDLWCSHSSAVEAGPLQVDFVVEAELLQVDDEEGTMTLHQAFGDASRERAEIVLP